MSRRCSYCNERGHNRRTCKTLKEDKYRLQAAADITRARLVSALESTGIVPGAMVRAPLRSWHSSEGETAIYLVKDIIFNDVATYNDIARRGMVLVQATNLEKKSYFEFTQLPFLEEFDFMNRHSDEETRYNADNNKRFVSESSLIQLMSGHKGYKFKKKNYAFNENGRQNLLGRFNINPKSYREEDKWRLNRFMEICDQIIEKEREIKRNHYI